MTTRRRILTLRVLQGVILLGVLLFILAGSVWQGEDWAIAGRGNPWGELAPFLGATALGLLLLLQDRIAKS